MWEQMAGQILLNTPAYPSPPTTLLFFPGLYPRRCGAIFGKCLRRGSSWPCSGHSFHSLSAAVCFTGLCTSARLLTLTWWSRKSGGWKPKCYEQQQGPAEPVSLPDVQAVTFKEAGTSFLPMVKQGAASMCQGFNQVPSSSVSCTLAADCYPGQVRFCGQ